MHNNSDLFEQFVRLEWLLHRYHHQSRRHHGPMGDRHRGQGRVLALLKLKPEISQKELAEILNIRSQSLGELLTKLERNGYITRIPSPTDRRTMDISLTEAGKQASEQNKQQKNTEALFSSLNEDEQAALSDYLNRITSTLEQQFGSDSESDFHDRRHFSGGEFGRHRHGEGSRQHSQGSGLGRGPGRGFGRGLGHGRGLGRGHGRHFHMKGGRNHFHGQGLGRRHNMGNTPDSSNAV